MTAHDNAPAMPEKREVLGRVIQLFDPIPRPVLLVMWELVWEMGSNGGSDVGGGVLSIRWQQAKMSWLLAPFACTKLGLGLPRSAPGWCRLLELLGDLLERGVDRARLRVFEGVVALVLSLGLGLRGLSRD